MVLDAGGVTSTGGLSRLNNQNLFPSTFSRGGADFTLANYLFGPRVSFKRGSRWVPYVQTLFGGATAWQSLPVPNAALLGGGVLLPNGAHLQFSRVTSGFAMTAGGGVDIRLSKHVYLRPIQAEYFLTRLKPIGDLSLVNRNNFRYSAGVNFTFGHPK